MKGPNIPGGKGHAPRPFEISREEYTDRFKASFPNNSRNLINRYLLNADKDNEFVSKNFCIGLSKEYNGESETLCVTVLTPYNGTSHENIELDVATLKHHDAISESINYVLEVTGGSLDYPAIIPIEATDTSADDEEE